MLDTASLPMTTYGVVTALVIFGIFIGTWWFYAMREKTS